VSTAVAVSRFDARPSGAAVALEWEVRSDAIVDGYRILRRPVSGGNETTAGPDLLPAGDDRYVDHDVLPDTEYDYTLVVVESGGAQTRSAPVRVRTAPLALELEQNIPNPFNPSTSISFVLADPGHVRLAVYDLRGALVVVLVDEDTGSGRRSVVWNGRTRDGSRAATGAYFYRLDTPAGVRTRKMLLLK